MFALLVIAVFGNVIHPGIGIPKVLGGGREWTWAFTLALFAAALVTAGYPVKSRWDGIFIDRDNQISLARFQIVLWTVLLVGSLFTAGITNATTQDSQEALAITIPKEIWALLGLGALTAIAAPAIKGAKRALGGPAQAAVPSQARAASNMQADQSLRSTPEFDGLVLVKQDARWFGMIQGDYEGSASVDTSKLQQLATTVLLVTVYSIALWNKMSTPGGIHGFPPVGDGFLALLGVSNAAYLADKQLART
jgi:hypothetical protein